MTNMAGKMGGATGLDIDHNTPRRPAGHAGVFLFDEHVDDDELQSLGIRGGDGRISRSSRHARRGRGGGATGGAVAAVAAS